MNKFYLFGIIAFFTSATLFAQDLTGIKVCIDPGHGGHESDDRYIAATGFWESESNLSKAFYVEELLTAAGATVILTRHGNGDSGVDNDPSLSEREAIANSNNVDFFHSIHSNGFQGNANYTLMLYEGTNSTPDNPLAGTMANIMAPHIYHVNYTTAQYVRGDEDFLGYNLGVLNDLNMPGTLSEGAFHDYLPESWRLQSEFYRKHEAWAIARAFFDYFEVDGFGVGNIAGIVRDAEHTVDYFYLTTADSKLPVNNLIVTLLPDQRVFHGDAMNNGYYLFDSLSPGDYELIIEAPMYKSDTVAVTVSANQSAFRDVYLTPDANFNFPPAAPDHIQAIAVDDSTVMVKCDEVSNALGYIVYYGTDAVSYPDSVVSAANRITITGLEDLTACFFQIKSYNDVGSSSVNTKCYAAVPSSNSQKVLIVNGFDRSTNTRHDYVKEYIQPLISAGYGFSYVLNESVYDGKIALIDYEVVIWILGDESTADDTFNPIEQDSVESFLKNGGKLFVSGSEIGWDLEGKTDHPSQADKDFYHNYLKADYIYDAPGNTQSSTYSAAAISGEIFDSIADFNFDNGSHGSYNVDWPDAINGINGGVNVLQYKNVSTGTIAAVRYDGLFPGGTTEGKLIYLAIPFEAVYAEPSRIEIMGKAFDYFDRPSRVTAYNSIVVHNYELCQNYPNPFNPVTTIAFVLPHAGHIRLDIYNLRGELVRTLADDFYSAGCWYRSWDSKNDRGHPVPSGVYIYRLTSDSRTLSRNMLLLK